MGNWRINLRKNGKSTQKMKPILDGTKETKSHWHSAYHTHRAIITVDFDHTITLNCPACPDWNGIYTLQKGVKAALDKLSEDFDIVILSGGGNYIQDYAKRIKRILDYHHIPYTRIESKKPPGCFMIDDRAIHHESWKSTMSKIRQRRSCGSR